MSPPCGLSVTLFITTLIIYTYSLLLIVFLGGEGLCLSPSPVYIVQRIKILYPTLLDSICQRNSTGNNCSTSYLGYISGVTHPLVR